MLLPIVWCGVCACVTLTRLLRLSFTRLLNACTWEPGMLVLCLIKSARPSQLSVASWVLGEFEMDLSLEPLGLGSTKSQKVMETRIDHWPSQMLPRHPVPFLLWAQPEMGQRQCPRISPSTEWNQRKLVDKYKPFFSASHFRFNMGHYQPLVMHRPEPRRPGLRNLPLPFTGHVTLSKFFTFLSLFMYQIVQYLIHRVI